MDKNELYTIRPPKSVQFKTILLHVAELHPICQIVSIYRYSLGSDNFVLDIQVEVPLDTGGGAHPLTLIPF